MFRRQIVIELGEEYIAKHNSYKSFEYKLNISEGINIDIKKSKVNIVLEGEEVNVRNFILPKTKSNQVYDLIKDELYYYFRNIDNLIFAYSIIKQDKDNQQFAVFCVNSNKLAVINELMHTDINIRGIYLLQFSVINYFKRKIKSENYIFIFEYRDKLYLLCCIYNKVIYNSIIKDYVNEENLIRKFYDFINKSKKYSEKNIENIYFANIRSKKIIDLISRDFKCEDLGDLNQKRLFRGIAAKRG
ncbi:hypothetical protein M2651_08325 [Clostridium sp. SYSU_GA19001]|uniref:hypothetical protein n=1 Tax=Clostridium caldaquaticum TaxID=2940653 RepID=UPI002077429A|nr:hypothetical protein [Clostridium caldaquaticum]MCM8711031.1 hypothetical protein [Clostridium caldaquaticum]